MERACARVVVAERFWKRYLKAIAFLSSLAVTASQALTTSDYAVQVSAQVRTDPPQIHLNWPADTTGAVTNYLVSRRLPGEASWTALDQLPASANSYSDTNVAVNGTYEYEIQKLASGFNGYGYVLAGIEAPLNEFRGKTLLVVDSSVAGPLTNELARLEQDLVGDGWQVQRFDVARDAAVTDVKALIQQAWLADPQEVRSVFLFGHAPVPYSGNLAPDGHTEHRGAWPADVYYGEMNGSWNDGFVNRTTAADPRNWNVPGDGKFDSTTLPSDVDLAVGRVDFANLPALSMGEIELLRQYLDKDHAFRQKTFTADNRGYIADYFGTMSGEAFAATAWRGFAALFTAEQQVEVPANTWFDMLSAKPALWAYGAGGGTYVSVNEVCTTSDYRTQDPGAVFSFLFGSYLGDWDSTNNVMRASLATHTYTLTCAWAGRPHWWIHTMALGDTIGHCAMLSQNNSASGPYQPAAFGTRQVHIALMGDPSLRLQPVAPPSAVQTVVGKDGSVKLTWLASAEPVLGYHVYRATNTLGPFERITSEVATGLSFTDSPPATAAYTYMVRAVKLETSGSGSYFNASQGAFVTVNNDPAKSGSPEQFQNPSSLSDIRIDALADGTMRLEFTTAPGATCHVEWAESLGSGMWKTLASTVADTNGNVVLDDPPAGRPNTRYYRAVLP